MNVESEVWSSDESEPSEVDPNDLPVGLLNNIEWDEETDYLPNQRIFYNNFHPSVKDFDGESNIREDVPLIDVEPLDFFKLFFTFLC